MRFAPQGATACSLGRQPQGVGPQRSLSPEGAAADHRSEKDCRRPFGAQRFIGPLLPGARAPGYMPLPLRGKMEGRGEGESPSESHGQVIPNLRL